MMIIPWSWYESGKTWLSYSFDAHKSKITRPTLVKRYQKKESYYLLNLRLFELTKFADFVENSDAISWMFHGHSVWKKCNGGELPKTP